MIINLVQLKFHVDVHGEYANTEDCYCYDADKLLELCFHEFAPRNRCHGHLPALPEVS